MLTRLPATLTECDEMIVRVEACEHEARRFHELAIECDCDQDLAVLYDRRARLVEGLIPPPRHG